MKQNYFLGTSREGFHHVAYTEWGKYSSELPALLCVHGLTRNSRDFDELACYMSNKGLYVLCPDIVGRGESSWFHHPGNYSFPQYISDMNTLIARANTPNVDWIGTSMGGLIGMMMAALPNSPIHRLVLNDIGPQIPIAGLRRLAQYAGKQPVFKSVAQAKSYFKQNYAHFGKLTDTQWDTLTEHSIKYQPPDLYSLKVDPGIQHSKSIGQMLTSFLKNPRKALEGLYYDIDLWAIWKNVHCPVLLIHGKKSDLLTHEIIIEMRKTHPLIEVYEIEDAGHAPALLEEKHHEKIYNWLNSF